MDKKFILFLSVFLIAVFFLPLNAGAGLAPEVYLTEINIKKNDFNPGEEIKGTVSLQSYEEFVISDLVFSFQLLGGEVDGISTKVIDREDTKETFGILPGQIIKKNFSYNLPSNLPRGDFKFRIQIINTRGGEMGWIDSIINIEGEGKFLILDNNSILLEGEKLPAGIGTYYQPGETPEVIFDITNNSSFSINAFPKVFTYKRNVSYALREEKKEEIILESGAKKTQKLFLPKLRKPESYFSEIKLYSVETGEPISNSVYFRWIISGQDAEILFVNSDKAFYEIGQEAKIEIQIAGPPDPQIPVEQGTIEVKLFDQQGNEVGKASQEISLSAGRITVNVPLSKEVINPKIKTRIIKDNKVLDEYSFNIVFEKSELEADSLKKINFWIGFVKFILILSIIFMAVIIYFLKRPKTKKKKIFKFSVLLFLFGASALFFSPNQVSAYTAVSEGCYGSSASDMVWNSPLPNKVYNSGDLVKFEGKIRANDCGNGMFFNKLTFYITEDKDIPITDCCGDSEEDCRCVQGGGRLTCATPEGKDENEGWCCCDEGCKKCYGANSKHFSSCSLRWTCCDEVKYLDESQDYKIYKLGTYYPPEFLEKQNIGWVEWNQSFEIPDDLEFSGTARFYMQFSGVWASTTGNWGHWHWQIIYQKGIVNPVFHNECREENGIWSCVAVEGLWRDECMPETVVEDCEPESQPPTAKISCDPANCQSYGKPPLILYNKSTDPDGIDDIIFSEWYIDYQLIYTCGYAEGCNLTAQNYVGVGVHHLTLCVEDKTRNRSCVNTTFRIKKDIKADFTCSFDNSNWQSCNEDFNPLEGKEFYLKDDSTASEGAVINSRNWKVDDSPIFPANPVNPSIIAVDGRMVIELNVEDNVGRSGSTERTIKGTSKMLPPKWKPISPFSWLGNLLAQVSGFLK